MGQTIFTGIATALITPFTETGVDYEAYGRLIDWQIACGVYALVAAGTSGEGSTLTVEEHKEVNAGIIFNSRAHLLGKYFRDKGEKFRLIGYDVIDPNITCLNDGSITHLIAQRPEVQGFNCIQALFRHLVLKEKVEQINYMPIDILMKENIKYYNNYI